MNESFKVYQICLDLSIIGHLLVVWCDKMLSIFHFFELYIYLFDKNCNIALKTARLKKSTLRTDKVCQSKIEMFESYLALEFINIHIYICRFKNNHFYHFEYDYKSRLQSIKTSLIWNIPLAQQKKIIDVHQMGQSESTKNTKCQKCQLTDFISWNFSQIKIDESVSILLFPHVPKTLCRINHTWNSLNYFFQFETLNLYIFFRNSFVFFLPFSVSKLWNVLYFGIIWFESGEFPKWMEEMAVINDSECWKINWKW